MDYATNMSAVKAVSIVDRAGVKGHDELGERFRAIVKWVQNNVVYRKDPLDVEYFMTPRRILKDVEQGRSAADCDDFRDSGRSTIRLYWIPKRRSDSRLKRRRRL
jgi:hypothetical protein